MDAVEEIKSRLSIDEVVADYLELKRSGRNFKARSPWTNEKTPSFMISPDKQIWHDFSSGRGGNMFSFIMEMEGVDFKGALEILARKAGVDLSMYGRVDNTTKIKERLYEILDLSAKYYQASLIKNPAAAEYLTKTRKFNRESLEAFRLGYAPLAEDALSTFLIKHGFSISEIKQAGVGVIPKWGTKKVADMFRGRIMIPLSDTQGRVVGFTSRILEDDPNSPKYINTPQTLLYDKSRHVYGLNLAKDSIRQLKYVVVVEGNLDVISSWQAGVKAVVATAGTAITEHHFKTLGRFCDDIRFAFDQDKAGLTATERAIPIAQAATVHLSMITIDGAKDPDELIKIDQTKWAEAVAKPIYVVDWLFQQYSKSLDLSSAMGKREFSDILLKTVAKLNDPVEQDHYIKKIAEATNTSEDATKAKLLQLSSSPSDKILKRNKLNVEEKPKADMHIYEDNFLSLLACYPTARRVIEMLPGEMVLSNTVRQKLYDYIVANPQTSLAEELPDDLPIEADYVKMLAFKAEQLYDKLDSSERLREAQILLARIRIQHNKQQNKALSRAVADAEQRGDQTAVQTLIKELTEKIRKQGEE